MLGRVTVLGIALTLVSANTARAQHQNSTYYGDAAAMTGASGMAVYRGGGSAWYNPAGIVGNTRSQIDLSASIFLLRIRGSSGLLRTRLPSGEYGADLNAVSFHSIPSALVFKRRLTPRVHAAFAVFVTDADSYRLTDVIDRDENFGFGTERYYQRINIESSTQTYHFGAVVGAAVHPRVRLGLGLYAVFSTYSYEFSTLTSSMAPIPPGGGAPAFAFLRANDISANVTMWALRLTLGLQWEFIAHWHFGLTIRTPAGELSYEKSFSDLISSVIHDDQPGFGGGLFQLDQDLEDVLTLLPLEIVWGLTYQRKEYYIGAEGEVLLPVRNFQTWVNYPVQWNIRAGARFALTDRVAMGLGFFTARSLRRLRSRAIFAGDSVIDYYGGVLAVKWRTAHRVDKRRRKDGIVFTTTIGLRYAYGTGRMIGVINDLQTPPGLTETIERDRMIHEISLYVGSSLYF